jgi:hypothetical protein
MGLSPTFRKMFLARFPLEWGAFQDPDNLPVQRRGFPEPCYDPCFFFDPFFVRWMNCEVNSENQIFSAG